MSMYMQKQNKKNMRAKKVLFGTLVLVLMKTVGI